MANSGLSILPEATGAARPGAAASPEPGTPGSPASGIPRAGSARGVRASQNVCSEPRGLGRLRESGCVCQSGTLQVLVLELNLSLHWGVCA